MVIQKKLIFGKGLMLPTISGAKKITLRKYRSGSHDFQKNELVFGEFMDGFTIILRITADTEIMAFSGLTDEIAREDGYENANDAFTKLKQYYPDLKKEDPLALIRYGIPAITGEKTIRLNEYN